MSYTKPVPIMITVRITTRQAKMLDEMTQKWGESLSDVVRDILERERKRRKKAAKPRVVDWLMVPPRRH